MAFIIQEMYLKCRMLGNRCLLYCYKLFMICLFLYTSNTALAAEMHVICLLPWEMVIGFSLLKLLQYNLFSELSWCSCCNMFSSMRVKHLICKVVESMCCIKKKKHIPALWCLVETDHSTPPSPFTVSCLVIKLYMN